MYIALFTVNERNSRNLVCTLKCVVRCLIRTCHYVYNVQAQTIYCKFYSCKNDKFQLISFDICLLICSKHISWVRIRTASMSAIVLSCLKHSGDDLKYQLSHIPYIQCPVFFSPEIRTEKIYIMILIVYKSRKQKGNGRVLSQSNPGERRNPF